LDFNDVLYGDDGTDIIHAMGGDDAVYGGAGNDTLNGHEGNDYLQGDEGNDLLQGFSGNDRLVGGDHNDTLKGGDDNDILRGGAGFDTLLGENGNDILFGDEGWDYLTGGAGADTFIFEELSDYAGNQYNRVRDFDETEDLLNIDMIIEATDYDPVTKILSDYVAVVESGAHTYIRVNETGSGITSEYTSVIMLEGKTGMDTSAQDMVDNGYLVI
jgi:Ca2+-binding RTX toxin-like protein